VTRKGRIPFVSIGAIALLLVGQRALGRPKYPGSSLVDAAFIAFLVVQVVQNWLLSRRTSTASTPALLSAGEWRWLAAGHGICALLIAGAWLAGLGIWWTVAGTAIYALAGVLCLERARKASAGAVAA